MADETKTTEETTKTVETSAVPVETPTASEVAIPAAEPEDTPEAKADDPAPFDPAAWGSTGDEVGDSVLELLHSGGATPDEAKALLYDAVQAGDPSKIDRDALVEKVGKAKANLIMAGVENYTARQAAKTAEAVQAVHTAAGGKENWERMVPWITKNVPESELDEYRGLIDQGGKQAAFAVAELRKLYNAAPGNTSLGEETISADSRSTKPATQGISQREYGDQLLILQRRGAATPEALTKLRAQRAVGRKQGL